MSVEEQKTYIHSEIHIMPYSQICSEVFQAEFESRGVMACLV